MGTAHAARVDLVRVRAIAFEYEVAAAIVDDAVRKHLSHLSFGATSAGRAYTGQGEALRDVLSGLAGAVRLWARASAEIAAALRASADHYREADIDLAGRLG